MARLFEIETDRVLLRWDGPPHPRQRRALSPLPGRLNVTPKRTGCMPSVRMHPDLPPPPSDTSETTVAHTFVAPCLYEESTYHLSIHPQSPARVEVRHRDPTVLRSLSAGPRGDLVGSVNFGSQVGYSTFTVAVDGVSEFDFEVEVFPNKIDYKTDYEQMLGEVTSFLMGLALEYLQATYRRGEAQRAPEPTAVEWLTLLRHVWQDLERALVYIAAHPRRRLIRAERYSRSERIRRVDHAVRSAVRRDQGRGRVTGLGDDLFVREYLGEWRAVETLDTPEHRWLRVQLVEIRQRLAHLLTEARLAGRSAAEGAATGRREALLTELTEMDYRLNRLLRLEPLAQALGGPPPAFSSLVLQSAPGYREAYKACLILRLGLRVEGGPFALSLKDIAALYEYWCYLSLLRLLSEEMGTGVDPKDLFRVSTRGLKVDLVRGVSKQVTLRAAPVREATGEVAVQPVTVRLAYNPTYASATGVHRPDVGLALQVEGWRTPFELIFDAKYRLAENPEYCERLGSPGPPEDAVNVLHRYRDAVLARFGGSAEASSVGEDERSDAPRRRLVMGAALFPYDGGDFRHNRFCRSLEEVGIGALPFLPSQTEFVREWIRSVLRQSGWSLAVRAPEHRAAVERASWFQAASEPALLAVLRPGVGQLDWVITNRLYYAPLERLGQRRFAAKWIAFYQGQRDRGGAVGAVTHEAEVLGVDVRRRREIATPWRAREPDELQIVYRLGEVRERPVPIEFAQGMRWFRWASRLSLSRARRGEELYLETQPEWELFDALRARRIPFTPRPGSPRVVDPEDIRGRVTFEIGRWRVRYQGRIGFRVEGDRVVNCATVAEVMRVTLT